MSQFTTEELKAADEAFRQHSKGNCPGDCGFCFDLELSGLPQHTQELVRIHRLKNDRAASKLAGTRAKSRQGSAPPLAKFSKKEENRRAKIKQQMEADRRYQARMCRPEKPRHDPLS